MRCDIGDLLACYTTQPDVRVLVFDNFG